MRSITTRVRDGVATATDGDGNKVRMSSFEFAYDDAHKAVALSLCATMGWAGKLQGGHLMKAGRASGMVWTWLDEDWLIEAPFLPKAKGRA